MTSRERFEAWWEKTGRFIDPEPGVPWSAKIRECMMHAFHARDHEVRELVEALRKIADSPFCSYENSGEGQYGIGVADGHRYCAQIARTILAKHESDGA